jgi:peptide subunit release factor 1 (eRF1)
MEASKQTAAEFYSDEKHIEMWKIKRLIKKLINTKGNGASFVSLYMPPKDNLNKINQKLTEEHSAAASIKSRVTRQSV